MNIQQMTVPEMWDKLEKINDKDWFELRNRFTWTHYYMRLLKHIDVCDIYGEAETLKERGYRTKKACLQHALQWMIDKWYLKL